MIDPITDMLNRIRNAQAVLKTTVDIPFSNLKYNLAKILEREDFVEKTEKKGKKTKRIIEITLKYDSGAPAIFGLKRVSRSGQRIYSKSKELKPVKRGYGLSIISTAGGLMTNREARKKKLGGEVICEVW